jgi:hypothetical protein
MKPQATHQEILLLNSTGLLKRQLCLNNNDPESKKGLSPLEQLEKACWDGLLTEMLPGVILNRATGCRNFVWEVFTTKMLIHINIGTDPYIKNRKASIDPCYFYQSLSLN